MSAPSIGSLRSRAVLLRSHAEGIPTAENFEFAEVEVPAPQVGQLLLRQRYLSVDPAMRGWTNRTPNYMQVPIGGMMRAQAVAEVLESRHVAFGAGDKVVGPFGWREYAVVDGDDVVRKVSDADMAEWLWLSVLGMSGLTAYLALVECGRLKALETVVVSSAAGSVGSLVGQIAGLLGACAIGIAGGSEKTALCTSRYGFEHAVDYKDRTRFEARLAEVCGDGVDVYFDNVAGPVSDAVMKHLAVGARVIVCGTASISSWDPPPLGPRVERQLLNRRASIQGFLCSDHRSRFDDALSQLKHWLRQGQLVTDHHFLYGIESCPSAIERLYRGEYAGKLLVDLTRSGGAPS